MENFSRWKDDEASLLELVEELEQKHGYVPPQVAEELNRLLAVKLERLQKIQSKIENPVHKDVEKHVERWKGEEGNLIMILHAIQNEHGYVPRAVAMELARMLDVKLARIYEVITFYHYFKLQPPGKHTIAICNGTACYLKGAPALLNELKNQLGVGEGQTTPDRAFHIDVVRCIGCCGMAPAITVDGKTYGKVKPSDIPGIVADIRKKDEVS